MAKVATALLKEAFIQPIRFALLLDDKFPVYPSLAVNQFDASLDNKRAKDLFELCRGQGWLCDVANRGAVAEKFESDKHLHQSDLLILDFNLDPLDQNDPTEALKILQLLAASAHFNLVIVYTNADATEVTRDIVFALGGGKELDAEASAAAEATFEDLDEETAKAVSEALTWATVDEILAGKNPRTSAADLRARLTEAGVPGANQPNVVTHLAQLRMRQRVKAEVQAARRPENHIDTSLGDQGAVGWAAQGNVFIAVVNKQEDASALLDRLVEALEAWNPSPLRVMMMHARAAIERAGSLADRRVLETPRLQAGWLLRILLSRSEIEHRESVGDLYGRLFERLARKVETSIVDFGMQLISPAADQDPVATARTLAGAPATLKDEGIYHALNEHISSEVCEDGPMTTGIVFKGKRGDSERYWLCTSPACDLVPGQNLRGWDGELKPVRPVSVVRLNPLKNAASIRSALEQATIGRHIFLFVGGKMLAFEVAEEKSRQMELETILLENDGCIVDGRFQGHVVDISINGDGPPVPTFSLVQFEVLAKLRSDYGNRLLAQSGQQRSRIGVDFFNLPEPPAD